MTRLTSEFWVQAYLRRVNGAGAFAGLRRRGARDAGAIFIIVDWLDGSADLYSPAPQALIGVDESSVMDGQVMDRQFERQLERVAPQEIAAKLEREARFDSDLWVIEVEDRRGRSFLEF